MLTRSRWWRPTWSVILVAWLVVALLEPVWPVPAAVIAVLTLVTVILLGLALTVGWAGSGHDTDGAGRLRAKTGVPS